MTAEAEAKVLEKAPIESKTLYLSKVERLELQNIDLQRKLLETQLQEQATKMDAQQKELLGAIEMRIGVSLQDCRVNLQTGEVTSPPFPEDAAVTVVQDADVRSQVGSLGSNRASPKAVKARKERKKKSK